MAAITRLAWRNLGRNRRRTVITGVALAVGVSLSVAGYGLMDGMSAELVRALTRYDLGHIQIHNKEFPKNHKLEYSLDDYQSLLEETRRVDGIRAASPRVYAYALVSRGGKSAGAELIGVDPATEPLVTTLDRELVDGSYLDAEPTPWPRGRALTDEEQQQDEDLTEEALEDALDEIDALGSLDEEGSTGERDASDESTAAETPDDHEKAGAPFEGDLTRRLAETISPPPQRPPRVYVGVTLARILGAKVGDRIHATGQTVDGLTEQVFFEVAGIFRTGTALFDRGRIYTHIADLQRFNHMKAQVHEIAAVAESPDMATGLAEKLRERVHDDRDLIRSWSEIRPDIEQMIELNDMMMAVMIFIIFIVATLGVVNTMLMAVFERTRELGMLKAIGMSGRRVVALIVTETILLVLAASALGTAIGFGLDLYMVEYGVDLSALTGGVSMGGVGLNPVIHGAVTVQGLVMPTLVLSITCLVASLYPAVRAARLAPAVGMRET
jgi:ABC-type lipoprotein release transport system permease subunit